ncbi:lipase/acyltransferase domain-containing protein [Nocardia brasiliensis]
MFGEDEKIDAARLVADIPIDQTTSRRPIDHYAEPVTFTTRTPQGTNAILVVPGIMGSELINTTDESVLWGLDDVRWYLRAWTSGSSLEALRLTDQERNGRYGRVRASRALRTAAFAPFLQGFEPYGRLIDQLRAASIHPDAVAEFPYDWRLPVTYNARLLADAIQRHLERWRERLRHISRDRGRPAEDPGVILVAHSMGGLLARDLTRIQGALDNVRATITLGTPFFGAVKSVLMIATGRGAPIPLPRRKLRALAAGLPGVYDLLPSYRSVDAGTEARRLLASDVGSIGGDVELAEASITWQRGMSGTSMDGHIQVVGCEQPTVQSVSITDGVATGLFHTCRPAADGIDRVNLTGDGTVSRDSAQLPNLPATPLAQSHGALAQCAEAILVVKDSVAGRDTGPWLGEARLGILLPDVVAAGSALRVPLTGVTDTRAARCRMVDVASNRQLDVAKIAMEEGQAVAHLEIPGPGLYRVELRGGGTSGVSEMVLATDPLESG